MPMKAWFYLIVTTIPGGRGHQSHFDIKHQRKWRSQSWNPGPWQQISWSAPVCYMLQERNSSQSSWWSSSVLRPEPASWGFGFAPACKWGYLALCLAHENTQLTCVAFLFSPTPLSHWLLTPFPKTLLLSCYSPAKNLIGENHIKIIENGMDK